MYVYLHIDRLRAVGVTVVELETAVDNAAAIQFYKRKDYFVEKTVPGYYSNHLDALVMQKDLSTTNAQSKMKEAGSKKPKS